MLTRISLFLALLPALAWSDQVTLKNGDRITGKIVKKDGDKLTIKSEFLGEVTAPWNAVTELTAAEPVVVVLPEGKSLTGSLRTSDGKLEVTTESGKEHAALAEVSSMRNAAEQRKYERLDHPSLLALWAGYFDIGLALARGNAHSSTFTTGLNASRLTRTDKMTFYFRQIYSAATVAGQTATTAEAVRGGWSYNKNFNPRLFVNTFNDYEYDKFQNLDLRFVLGGGLGLNAVKGERAKLDLTGGAAYNRENFSTQKKRTSGEAYFGNDWTYKVSGVTSLTQSFRVFPNLTETGEYRLNFDLGTAMALKKWLSWQVTAADRLLSNPAVGRKRNDVLLVTGFRITFAR